MGEQKIFITGATSGIGKRITELCLEEGYIVYATGQNETILSELADKGAVVFKANLQNEEEIEKLCNDLPEINVAILNAGIGYFEYFYHLSKKQMEDMIDLNIRAPIYLAHYISKKMIHNNSGQLIFIGSQAGKVATKKASVYASTKHAITGFINGLRMELQPYHIIVTGIFPGPIDTPFIQKADSTGTYRKSMKRFLLSPEKVAKKVVDTIGKPVREVNLPKYMALTSKIYALAPALTEKLGKTFFLKK